VVDLECGLCERPAGPSIIVANPGVRTFASIPTDCGEPASTQYRSALYNQYNK